MFLLLCVLACAYRSYIFTQAMFLRRYVVPHASATVPVFVAMSS
jgi:hypothetical protein